jgi:uncharacterized Zn-binding protein involved in type VI secretion
MMCTFGVAPAILNALPTPKVLIEGKPAATIMTSAPMVNVPPFGMCMSLSNPTVATATAAALGVLTPMPCVPVTASWAPGAPKTLIGGLPALVSGSVLTCTWGGVIQLTLTGAVKTTAN